MSNRREREKQPHVPLEDFIHARKGCSKGEEEVEIHNPVLIEWIRESAQRTELLASVCTGALLLAQAGLSSGKKATTHWRIRTGSNVTTLLYR